MRKIVIGGLVLGAFVLLGCDDKSSGGNAAPSASAAPSAAPAPSSAAPAPSGSAKADNDKPEKEKKAKAEAPKDFKARVKALSEAWASHDSKKIADLYADDAVIKVAGQPDVKGHDDIAKHLDKHLAAFKDITITAGRVWEKDKHSAVVEWVEKGTNTGDAPDMGLPKATNKPFGIVSASWIEVNDDGFIKEERIFMDGPTLIGQLVENKKEEKKNPVRGIVAAPPDGTAHHESAEAKAKDAKDPKEKAELDKVAETEKKNVELEDKFIGWTNDKKDEDIVKLTEEKYKGVDYTQPKDIVGRKEFKEMMHTWRVAFPDIKVKSLHAFGDHDFAIEELEYTGVQKGALGPIKATNKPVTVHYLSIDEIRDGKVVATWTFGDSNELLSQLGVVSAAEKMEEKK
jgi:steroid delta-isomerase-like uncharacterized protein